MKIVVIGTGYVGLVQGTCLADSGHTVTCVDIDENKVAMLLRGEIPIYEPGLDELVIRNAKAGRLKFTTDTAKAVADGAEVVFLAVGTPPGDDGSAELKYLFAAAKTVANSLVKPTVVVTKSTVPVGTGRKLQAIFKEQAKQRGVEELFEQVLVPTEKVTEVRRGRKMEAERKFFPGYVLVKCEMTDEAYHLIKNTPKVTGFLGSSGKPQPISEREAARYFGAREQAAAQPRHQVSVDYEIGDSVKVLDGPFARFNGLVEELDFDTNRVKVSVSIFGRATPVELDFEQVELSK